MTETEYWKRVALWMADVHAANLAQANRLKKTSKSEKDRQASITTRCIDYLSPPMKGFDPRLQRQRGFKHVIDRLQSNLEREDDTT